jgi:lysophospholipase L1-like esterase
VAGVMGSGTLASFTRTVLGGALIGGAICFADPARADDSPARQRYAVAAVGDSLTDPRSGGGGYLGYLKTQCPASRFDAFGKGGEMVSQMRTRFARDVLAEDARYTHVIVFGGVNDLYSDVSAGRTPALIEDDLAAMYAAARRRGIAVVAITVAPWGGFTRYYNARRGAATLELNRWIEAQGRAGSVDSVVDAYGLLSCGTPNLLCRKLARKDRLHLNAQGHDKLGAARHRQIFSNCE